MIMKTAEQLFIIRQSKNLAQIINSEPDMILKGKL